MPKLGLNLSNCEAVRFSLTSFVGDIYFDIAILIFQETKLKCDPKSILVTLISECLKFVCRTRQQCSQILKGFLTK